MKIERKNDRMITSDNKIRNDGSKTKNNIMKDRMINDRKFKDGREDERWKNKEYFFF